MPRALTAVFAVVWCAASLLAQPVATTRPAHDPAEDLRALDGLAITLAAESPLLFNPTAMDVDASGRLWITEAVNYRKWANRNPGAEHPDGDRVVVLSDDDGDGRYDRSTVFVQEPRLVAPLGIAVFGNRVVVSCSPDLIVYHDDDGDLVADRSEVLLTGFGGRDHDHGLHSVVAGPDGRWYFAVGNAGPHLVTDRGGWTLRSGSLYTGGGEHPADNKPGLVSDDGRVWVGGLIGSVQPDGTDLRVHAHNFRNPYEVALDAFGRMFTADNDDDGNRGCRTTRVMEGGNHGYFSADGSRYWMADRRPGQDTAAAHWHQDDPGVVPAGTINGAGGPTGVAVYEAPLMADWIDGAVLNADAGAGRVYAHRPREVGAGVVLDPGLLLWSREDQTGRGARWFRPSDVCVAPDGSVLVADWYDPGVGGHLAGDAAAYGRILRVLPAGHRVSVPAVDETGAGWLDRLSSPAVNVRQHARERLATATMTDALAAKVLALVDDPDPRVRAAAAWFLAVRPGDEKGLTLIPSVALAADVDPRVAAIGSADARPQPATLERAVTEAEGGPPAMGWALAAAEELLTSHGDGAWPATVRRSDERARRPEAVADLALAVMRSRERIDPPAGDDPCLAMLVRLAALREPGDAVSLEALGLAAEGLEQSVFLALAGDVLDDPLRWSARVADIAWRLHPAAAIPGLAARAGDLALPIAERRRMLDALGFCPAREAAEGMLALAMQGPDHTRELARWWVTDNATTRWRSHGLALPTLDGELEDATRIWHSGVLRDALLDVDVELGPATALWLMVDDAGDGNACDWAAIVDPALVLDDGGRQPLTAADALRAEAAWGSVRDGRNCTGGPLRAAGLRHPTGIGTHARSVLAWDLPAGARRFRARLGPDEGGTGQGSPSPTSIRFELRVTRPVDRGAQRALEAVVVDAAADPDAREEAALQLLDLPDGALALIDLRQRGALDDALAAAVGEEIFAHDDPTVRALAHGLFPRPGAASPLPPLELLAALPGDPSRGRAVFTSAQAQCSTCHRAFGLGADVGPDLSEAARKLDRPALLDAILNPSAGIAHGYDAWLVTTADGRRLTGFVLADGDPVLFKDTAGKRHVLPGDALLERRALTRSIMPEGVASGLEPRQIADLLAFLGERRGPDDELPDPATLGTLGEPVVLFDGSSLDAWVPFVPDGARSSDTWSVGDGELRCEGKPIGYLRTRETFTDFVLELDWRFLPGRDPGNSGVLLRLNGDDKLWPRSIECQLMHRDAGDLWNIDAMSMVVDAARTSGRRTVRRQPCNERPLGEWNHYRIVLVRDRLWVEVNGELQNTAAWCEELAGPIALQSEGAPIAFRDVVLTPVLR